jgi:hypothetical protein
LGSRRLKAHPETSLSCLAETESTFHEVGGLVTAEVLVADLPVTDLLVADLFATDLLAVVALFFDVADRADGVACPVVLDDAFDGFVAAEALVDPNGEEDCPPTATAPNTPTALTTHAAASAVNPKCRLPLQVDSARRFGTLLRTTVARLNIEASIARMCLIAK